MSTSEFTQQSPLHGGPALRVAAATCPPPGEQGGKGPGRGASPLRLSPLVPPEGTSSTILSARVPARPRAPRERVGVPRRRSSHTVPAHPRQLCCREGRLPVGRSRDPSGPRADALGLQAGARLLRRSAAPVGRRSPPGTSRRPGTRVAGAFVVPASSDRLLLRTARSKPSALATRLVAHFVRGSCKVLRPCFPLGIARRSISSASGISYEARRPRGHAFAASGLGCWSMSSADTAPRRSRLLLTQRNRDNPPVSASLSSRQNRQSPACPSPPFVIPLGLRRSAADFFFECHW